MSRFAIDDLRNGLRGAAGWPLELAACAVFVAVWLRGYIWPLDGLLYAEGVKGQDAGQMVWNLWQTAEALARGRNPFVTDMIFAPVGAPLAQHTLSAGYAPLTLLVKFLSGNAPLYPLYAYHLIIWLGFALLLFFSYKLLRSLDLSFAPAALAAAGYAFSDFYTWRALHISQIAGFFLPLIAWRLVRWWQDPTPRRLCVAAALFAWSIYFTELTAYFGLAVALGAALLCATADGRAQLRDKTRAVGWFGGTCAAGLGLAIAAPLVWQLLSLDVRKPLPIEASYFSANLAGLFVPYPEQSPVYGSLFNSLAGRITAGMNEPGAFLGFPVLLLIPLGLCDAQSRRDDATSPSLLLSLSPFLLALFILLLSLGPALQVFGVNTGLPLPYEWLRRGPVFDMSRTPVRFVSVAGLLLMVLAARGAEWLLTRRRVSVFALLCLWVLAESYVPAPPVQKFAPPDLSTVAGPVLNLPLYRTDGYAALLQTQHHQSIATGYLARDTQTTWAHYQRLERLLRRGAAFCEGVKELGYQTVIIAPETTYVDPAPNFAALKLRNCGLNVIDLRAHPETDERPAAFPLLPTGRRVEVSETEAAPFLWFGWSGREDGFRWTDGDAAALAFALEDARPAVLRLRAGAFRGRQRVELELNGTRLPDLEVNTDEASVYEIPLPALRRENTLRFMLPDAAAPMDLGLGADARLLGLRVEWFELKAVR